MVVVRALAGDVGMVAAGQVQPLDDAQLGEHVQRPEDRGAAKAPMLRPGGRDQVRGSEVAGPLGDQAGDRQTCIGRSVGRGAESRDER